jgi:hypothetical protein
MHPFVRFIFITLVAAIVVNLAFVLVANSRSHARHEQETAARRAQFREMLERVSGYLRRADMIVEKQTVDHHNTALETVLLVRQYKTIGTSQSLPQPVRRLTISGDVVKVDGLVLKFDDLFFKDEDPDLNLFAGKTLVYFSRFYGKDAIDPPPAPDARFTFTPVSEVPELTQLEPLPGKGTVAATNPLFPEEIAPSSFEVRVWQQIWRLLGEPPRDTGVDAWYLRGNERGMTFQWV